MDKLLHELYMEYLGLLGTQGSKVLDAETKYRVGMVGVDKLRELAYKIQQELEEQRVSAVLPSQEG
jgi:hypothetical protein